MTPDHHETTPRPDDKDRWRVDRTAFSVASLDDESDDKEYWATKSPHERLAALEFMRRAMYGTDRTRGRLQRVLEIVELDGS